MKVRYRLEHLLSTDAVHLFYSDSNHNMEQRNLDNIKNSGCAFEVHKLVAKGKNGLDFYIATKLGELFGSGRCKIACIISKDTGYQSLRDYWQNCAPTKRKVYQSRSIEEAFAALNDNPERTSLIRQQRKQADIGQFYAAYQESLRIRQLLCEAFSGTTYLSRLREIQDTLQTENGDSPKALYLTSLRRFGRKDGLAIYHTLRDCSSRL